MKIENGTLTISASYGLKVPGAVDFSMQDVNLGIQVALPVTGEYDAIVDNADAMEALLVTQLKLAVYSQLGLGVTEDESGTIQPDLTTLPSRTGAPSAPRAAAPSNGGGGGGNYPPKAPSKAQQAGIEIPKYSLPIDGVIQEVSDFRPLKQAGVYKPTAADFKVGQNSLWLVDKKGNINAKASEVAQLIAQHAPFEAPAAATF